MHVLRANEKWGGRMWHQVELTGQVRYGGTEIIGVSIRGLSWREKKAITFNCLIPITSYISSRELKE